MEALQTRVILWTHPRSLATAFEKWIGFSPKVQVINDPYATAHDIGPERAKLPDYVNTETIHKWYGHSQDDPNGNDGRFLTKSLRSTDCSFSFVKDLLEQEYRDRSIVFCKDLSYSIHGRFDMLPVGYQHTFLIRNPYKTLMSWRKLMVRCLESENQVFDLLVADALYPALSGYKKQWELLGYLQEQGSKIIVVDADDLQKDPSSILGMYCQKIGVRFQENMLHWEAGCGVMRNWISARSPLAEDQKAGSYSETTFLPPTPAPKRHDIPFDLLEYIDSSMPYYLKMYGMRITP